MCDNDCDGKVDDCEYQTFIVEGEIRIPVGDVKMESTLWKILGFEIRDRCQALLSKEYTGKTMTATEVSLDVSHPSEGEIHMTVKKKPLPDFG